MTASAAAGPTKILVEKLDLDHDAAPNVPAVFGEPG